MKADTGDGNMVWCSVIGFGDVGERLATLKSGAAISVSGRAKLSSWLGKDGSPAAGLDVTVDEVATLRGRPKPPSDRRQPTDTDDAGVWRS
jgi:single-stranded DNA-binding protein